MALLELCEVSFHYPNEPAVLKNINLQIESGEFVVLMGQSGCGKTTLLKQLKKEIAPQGSLTGNIMYKEKKFAEQSNYEASAEIGYVFQNPENQIVTDHVWHELAFGLENLGLESSVIKRRVAEMAHYFGIQEWFHQKTANLTGGQKQLLNLASIMVMQPNVLLLDEPTSQLDPIAAKDFINTLKQLHEELGLTIILVEHRLEEVLAIADRVVVMECGEIIYDGFPNYLMKGLTKNHPLVAALPTPMRIALAFESDTDLPLTIREGQQWLQQHSSDFNLLVKPIERIDSAIILEAKDVDFRYEKAGKMILNQFSLQVRKGYFVTIVGGNGSGKSTALQILAGLLRPQSGVVKIHGKKLKAYNTKTLYQNIFAVMPQDPKVLFVEKTVEEELHTMANAFEIEQQRVDQVLNQFGLQSFLERHPYDLSGGEQQKLAFAKLLIRDPEILLLDEPTKGLDAYAKNELAHLLKGLQQQGMTIVMVTHDIEFSAQYSDECAMFFDGNIASMDNPRNFYCANHFYTTAAHRMARKQIPSAILDKDVIEACKG